MYFSGMSGGGAYPETLIHEKEPEVMLSFYDLKDKTPGATAWQRFNKHRESLP